MTDEEALDKMMRICNTIFCLTLEGGPLRICPFCHETDSHDPERCILLQMEIHFLKILYGCKDAPEPSRQPDTTDEPPIIPKDPSLILKWRRRFGKN